jgi:hypothetical protein
MTPTSTFQEKEFFDTKFDERKERLRLRAFQQHVTEAGADWGKYYRTSGVQLISSLGSSLDPDSLKKSLPIQSRVFINKATSKQGVLNFRVPLEIEVTKTEEGFFTWCEEFHVSGHGDTLDEAFRDLYAFLVHIFFSYLHTDPSEMGPEAISHFNRFKELLERYEELPS